MSQTKPVLPSSLRVFSSIARVTFDEIVRDKILYNSVIISILLLAVSMLAGQLSFFRPERIILDFGLSAVNISITFIAILLGSSLVLKEFERRTVFVALSKPITRFQFLIGKFLGLSLVLFANWLLLTVCYLTILKVSGGEISGVLGVALFLLYLQALMAGALSILFSTFSTVSLSVMMTVGVYLIGINVSQMLFIAQKTEFALGRKFLQAIAHLVPDFEKFNLGTKVTYGLEVIPGQIWTAVFYAVVSIALYLVIAGVFVQRREN